VLRWAVQSGLGIIPKSATESRMRENLDFFVIPPEGMAVLDQLAPSASQARLERADPSKWTGKVSLIVVNKTPFVIQWFWKSGDENELLSEEIGPHSTSYQSTWKGHVFLASSSGSNGRKIWGIYNITYERIQYIEIVEPINQNEQII
jgi:hypothetical protein